MLSTRSLVQFASGSLSCLSAAVRFLFLASYFRATHLFLGHAPPPPSIRPPISDSIRSTRLNCREVAPSYLLNSQWSPVITSVALSDGFAPRAEAIPG